MDQEFLHTFSTHDVFQVGSNIWLMLCYHVLVCMALVLNRGCNRQADDYYSEAPMLRM